MRSSQWWAVLTSAGVTAVMLVSSAAAATIGGTSGDDHLVGTRSADVINAYAGDDWINPRAGSDLVYGGPGGDTILVSFFHANEPDRVFAGPGDDTVRAGEDDKIVLGRGNDLARTQSGGNMWGGLGKDRLLAGEVDGGAKLRGGPGDDLACGFSDDLGNHTFLIRLGSGDDRAMAVPACRDSATWASRGRGTVVHAGSGADWVILSRSSGSHDEVYAGTGNDRIRIGNPQQELVDCGPGRDTLILAAGAQPDVRRGCEVVQVIPA